MSIQIKNVWAMLLLATTTLSFTACSSDNNDTNSAAQQDNEIEAITTQYVNDVVYDTYSKLATQSERLYSQINALKQKLNNGTSVQQSEIDAICDTYKAARKEWEDSEAFLYGAASDFEIDPHIDTWPLDVAVLASDLADDKKIEALNGEGGIDYARENLTAENLGFHGIEFIFFRDGKNRSVAIFNNDVKEDYENYFTGKNVTGKEEVIFATAVAGDLRDKCYQLEVSWMGTKASAQAQARINELYAKDTEEWKHTAEGSNNLNYGENMLQATKSGSTYNSWKKVAEQIFDGCSNICAEVADQKMGQAYRAAIGKPEQHEDEETGEMVDDDPNYIESPYSHNSFTDFTDNIQSIKNSLYGGRNLSAPTSTSIMAYLTKYNAEEADKLNAKLAAALAALAACQNSGKAFVEAPGATYVVQAIQVIGELDNELGEAKNWLLRN